MEKGKFDIKRVVVGELKRFISNGYGFNTESSYQAAKSKSLGVVEEESQSRRSEPESRIGRIQEDKDESEDNHVPSHRSLDKSINNLGYDEVSVLGRGNQKDTTSHHSDQRNTTATDDGHDKSRLGLSLIPEESTQTLLSTDPSRPLSSRCDSEKQTE